MSKQGEQIARRKARLAEQAASLAAVLRNPVKLTASRAARKLAEQEQPSRSEVAKLLADEQKRLNKWRRR